MVRQRPLAKLVVLGSLVSVVACGSGSAPDEPASSEAAGSVESSARTRAELGIDGWAIDVAPGDAKVEGRTHGNEVIARFQAIASEDPETHRPVDVFVVSRGAAVARLVLVTDPDSGEVTIQESSFTTQPDLARVLELLRDDLASSAGDVGARAFGRLQPQAPIVGGHTGEVALVKCTDDSNAYASARANQGNVCQQCGRPPLKCDACQAAGANAIARCREFEMCEYGLIRSCP